jgi:hypothetical protein
MMAWPTSDQVLSRFGSWEKFMSAAGYEKEWEDERALSEA